MLKLIEFTYLQTVLMNDNNEPRIPLMCMRVPIANSGKLSEYFMFLGNRNVIRHCMTEIQNKVSTMKIAWLS